MAWTPKLEVAVKEMWKKNFYGRKIFHKTNGIMCIRQVGPRSAENKRKMRIIALARGKKSEREKQKISDSMKQWWVDHPEARKKSLYQRSRSSTGIKKGWAKRKKREELEEQQRMEGEERALEIERGLGGEGIERGERVKEEEGIERGLGGDSIYSGDSGAMEVDEEALVDEILDHNEQIKRKKRRRRLNDRWEG